MSDIEKIKKLYNLVYRGDHNAAGLKPFFGWFISNNYAEIYINEDGYRVARATDKAKDYMLYNQRIEYRDWESAYRIDYSIYDRVYWKNITREIMLGDHDNIVIRGGKLANRQEVVDHMFIRRDTFRSSREWSELYARTISNEYNHLIERYGKSAANKINSKIDKILSNGNFQFKDNWRVAKKSRKNEVRQYVKARKTGCCGFFDEEYQINFEKYLIGFNYGH